MVTEQNDEDVNLAVEASRRLAEYVMASGPLPGDIGEALVPHCCLLEYFGLSTLGLCNADQRATETTSRMREWALSRRCSSRLYKTGKVIASPKEQQVEEEWDGYCATSAVHPTLLATHCVVHALWTTGSMDDAVASGALRPSRVAAFVAACQTSNGAFQAGADVAEVDVRWSYGAAVVLYLLKPYLRGTSFATEVLPELAAKATRFVCSCQTAEGGFAGTTDCPEAHAGMTYCAVASLVSFGRVVDYLLDCGAATKLAHYDDVPLRHYTARRLSPAGFTGRPNKPADTCYSWWVGAVMVLLDMPTVEAASRSRALFVASKAANGIGVARSPCATADPMHSYFSMAGWLCLSGRCGGGAKPVVDPLVGIALRQPT